MSNNFFCPTQYLFAVMTACCVLLSGCGTEHKSSSLPLALEQPPSFKYANDTVQLLRAVAVTDKKSGVESNYRCTLVRAKDFSATKEIFIWGQFVDESWGRLNTSSEFLRQAEPGYEIWQACAFWNTVRAGKKWSTRFAIQYVSGNVIHWDNNQGIDYRIGLHDGVMIPASSGVSILLNQATLQKSFHGSNTFSGTIDVKNLSLDKKIKISYSTDKWRTKHFTYATYAPLINIPYAESIKSPNLHGVERWSFEVEPGDVSSLVFALEYSAPIRSSQWDNNFNRNYLVSSDTPISILDVQNMVSY